MKKSNSVKLLVLVGVITASCESKKNEDWSENNSSRSKMYLRSDSTRPYTGSFLPYYFAFRAFGYYNARSGGYSRVGYSSASLSNKSSLVSARGGFGGSGYRVSS